MRMRRVLGVVGVLTVIGVPIGSCTGSDDGSGSGGEGSSGASPITVALTDDIPSIVSLRDVTCSLAEDGRELVAGGVVESSGDATHYVELDVRFLDEDDVRVELASDSVSDLQVGEAARWEATAYSDDAADVRRCEVSATVG